MQPCFQNSRDRLSRVVALAVTAAQNCTHPTADAKVHIRPLETAETVGVAVPATILEPRELPYPW
jgi:hypothetical protein